MSNSTSTIKLLNANKAEGYSELGEHTKVSSLILLFISMLVWSEQLSAQDVSAKITPFPAAFYQDYGSAVAVSDQIAVIGAPGDATNKGAVYIYDLVGTTWQARPKLVAIDGAVNDKFGASVAVNSNMIVIGAPGINNGTGGIYSL
ncbi:MAG TPA: FG-GAP repeat protein [Chitinophagales bacterium]|nr:FG-GAP repeat protein [Chitinophagales bacterium]